MRSDNIFTCTYIANLFKSLASIVSPIEFYVNHIEIYVASILRKFLAIYREKKRKQHNSPIICSELFGIDGEIVVVFTFTSPNMYEKFQICSLFTQ